MKKKVDAEERIVKNSTLSTESQTPSAKSRRTSAPKKPRGGELKEKYELAFKHSPVGICISTLQDGRYVEVNEVYSSFLGYRRNELIGRTSAEIHLWVDPAERDALLRSVAEKGAVVGFELRFRDKQGKIHWGAVAAAVVAIGGQSFLLTQTQDITEKKNIEREFSKTESRYRLLADHITDTILTLDLNLRPTYISPSAYALTGYTPDEIQSMKVEDFVDEQTRKTFYAVLAEELEKEKLAGQDPHRSRVVQYQHTCKDGSKKWVEAKVSFLRDEQERPVGIVGVLRDVTDRKATEEKLRYEQLFFESVTEQSSDIILLINQDGIVTYCNRTVEKYLGYSVREMTGSAKWDLIHAEDLPLAKAILNQFFRENQKNSITSDVRLRHRDGSWRLFEATASRLADNGTLNAVIINLHDITERRRAEEQALAEYSFSRVTLDSLSVPFFMIKLENGMFFRWNKAFAAACGYSDEEIAKLKPVNLVPETERKRLLNLAEKFNVQKNVSFEMTVVSKSGALTPYLLSGNLVEFKGEPYVVGIGIDITERKRTEEALINSEEKYRTLLDDIQEGYFELDLAGNLTFVNNATCRDLGYSKDELIGMNNRQYMDGETAQQLFRAFKRLYTTGEPIRNLQWQVIRKDGTKAYTEGSISLRKDASGKIIGFRGIAHDITASKQAQELLKQSEEKYRLLADHMKDQVWLMDLDLNISYVSPSVEKALGYSFEELKEIPLEKILTPDSFRAAMNFFAAEMPKALTAPPSYVLQRSLELEFISKNGQITWGEVRFSFIRDENGKPVSILGEGRDITERKQMEEALRKSEENFRRSLDESPLGVRISSAHGETLYANRAILDIYGYDSIEELQNTPIEKRYTPESYAEYLARRAKRLRGEPGPAEYEVSIIRKDGEVRHLYAFRKQIYWNGKKQAQVIYQDITLRRQAEEKLNETLENLRQSIKITISVLGTASEAKDPYMAGHQKRVADLARAIATEMKLPNEKIEAIRMASAIHDIGKISVPSEILCKPAVLSDLEFSLIKGHPQYGYEIIKDVESPWPLADIVHQHHERLDGSGYPLGLKEKDILIEARVLAVADVVEAMISYRPYRPALGLRIALEEIEKNAGILYDRKVVEACLRLFREKNYQIV
jgi:PAS domain S-box-containing protein